MMVLYQDNLYRFFKLVINVNKSDSHPHKKLTGIFKIVFMSSICLFSFSQTNAQSIPTVTVNTVSTV